MFNPYGPGGFSGRQRAPGPGSGTLIDLDQRPYVCVVILLELVPHLIVLVPLLVDFTMRALSNKCVVADT